MKPDPKILQEFFSYDIETGDLIRIKSRRKDMIGRKTNNVDTAFLGKNYKTSHIIWALVFGYWPKDEIDHINGCHTDNRLINLREATRRENQYNRVPKNKGVVELKDATRKKRFRAVIRLPGQNSKKNLGHFATREEAEKAYERAARQLHGNYYWGNT